MGDASDPLAALARLRSASRAFTQATGVDSVVDTLIERTLDALDAVGALVVIPHGDGTLEVLASSYPDAALAPVKGAQISEAWPLTDALRSGLPSWFGTRDEIAGQYPDLAGWMVAEAYIALPLQVGPRVVGAVGIAFREPQVFAEAQRLYLLALADMCAMVLDRHVLESRRSEQRLRALVDSNLIGVIGGDATHITEANDAFLEMVGLDRAALATGLRYQDLTAPEFADADARAVTQGGASGRFGPYEKEFLHRDGTRVPTRIVGAVLSIGDVGRWVALVEDLSAHRAAEAELKEGESRYRSLLAAEIEARANAERSAHFAEALSRMTAAVASARDDEGVAAVAGEWLVSTLECDGALIARSGATGRVEEMLYQQGYLTGDLAAVRNDARPTEWSTGVALAKNAPVFYERPDDYIAQFPERRDLINRMGSRAWAVVPLVAAEQVLGFVVAMFRRDHKFGADERRFLATLGDVTAQAMLRARARAAEELVRRSMEVLTEAIAAERTRLAAVLQRMPAGLVVVDADSARVVLSNPRATEILGPPAEALDQWFALRSPEGPLINPEDTPWWRALRGDEAADLDDAFVVRPDGSSARARISAVPIRDSEQRVTSAVVVIEDITEQARRERDAQLLARVSDLLGSEHDVNEVLDHVVALSVPTFADACAVWVVNDNTLQLLAIAHTVDDQAEEMRRALAIPVPIRPETGLAKLVRTGEPVVIPMLSDEFYYRRAGHPAQTSWLRDVLRPRSVLAVALRRAGDRITGVLAFTQTADSERIFGSDDIGVALELATRCSLLLEQVSAHRATTRARDRADRLQRYAAAMARAASVDAVVRTIASDGVAAVDGYVVNVAMRVETETSIDFVQTRRLHPASRVSWHGIDADANDALTRALRRGRPGYYPDAASYEEGFPGGEEVLALNDAQAVACLPLFSSEGNVIGAIGYTFRSEQPFDEDQRGLLETVADVAAQSLDRARLFERERDVAGALQMALLPTALPELDDIVTEARYVAGGAGVSVGGDWYDVLRFADGRVGLLIGDAAGRGVEAATLMGKVRHAAAALAMDNPSPAIVLARVNEFLHTISTRRDMVTCCYIVVDHDAGLLRYASAGHPPPVVVEDGGAPRFLDEGRGVPLGVIPTAVYSEAEYTIGAPSTIVLYTDGLIERRGETIDVGLERLLDAIRGHGLDVRALCDHLTGTLLTPTSDDDVALLATRICSVPNASRLDLKLPADSRRLHELRTRVSRWLADAGVSEGVIPEVVIALNEAASNSMVHAYAGRSVRGHVRVSVAVGDSSLTATITDDGDWREAHANHDGRGLEMMQALMTDVRVERGDDGTRVHLIRVMSG